MNPGAVLYEDATHWELLPKVVTVTERAAGRTCCLLLCNVSAETADFKGWPLCPGQSFATWEPFPYPPSSYVALYNCTAEQRMQMHPIWFNAVLDGFSLWNCLTHKERESQQNSSNKLQKDSYCINGYTHFCSKSLTISLVYVTPYPSLGQIKINLLILDQLRHPLSIWHLFN